MVLGACSTVSKEEQAFFDLVKGKSVYSTLTANDNFIGTFSSDGKTFLTDGDGTSAIPFSKVFSPTKAKYFIEIAKTGYTFEIDETTGTVVMVVVSLPTPEIPIKLQ